jgi:hypothetical protein
LESGVLLLTIAKGQRQKHRAVTPLHEHHQQQQPPQQQHSMGCKNATARQPDPDEDLTPVEKARVEELAGTTQDSVGNDKNKEEEADTEKTVGRGFANLSRRDSIRINKDAIAKRKQHAQNVADGTSKEMPRAFMKPGQTSSVPIAKSKTKRGFGRRDSIKVNKDNMERKKKRGGDKNTAAPSGISVEVVDS